jgi:hypothetical protein
MVGVCQEKLSQRSFERLTGAPLRTGFFKPLRKSFTMSATPRIRDVNARARYVKM